MPNPSNPYPNPQLTAAIGPASAGPGGGGRSADGRTPIARAGNGPWWMWVLLLILVAAVVVRQQWPKPTEPDFAARAAAGRIKYPAVSIEYTLPAKMYFGLKGLSPDPNLPRMLQESVDSAAGFADLWPQKPSFLPAVRPKPDAPPPPAHARLYAAILAADTLNPGEAEKRLDRLELQLDPESPLVADVALLRRMYAADAPPAAEIAAAMEPADREAFEQRHGLFARLALSFGDDAAAARRDAASSGLTMLLTIMFFGGAAGLAILAGFAVLIYFVILALQGRLRRRFVPPGRSAGDAGGDAGPGQGVWLEMVSLFVGGFLFIGLAGDLLGAAGVSWAGFLSLGLQWLLVLVIFWPVVRGMSWERWRGEIGWHSGRGVAREVGAGLLVYLACLPIYFFTAFLLVIAMLIWSALSGTEPARPIEDNKVFEIASSGNPVVLILIFMLASVWAPIVEESIFRGALYRRLRLGLPFIGAALISAALFSIMHGYAVVQLVLVGVLGLMFAIIREWRGSIIGAAAVHCVHNTVVFTFAVLLLGQAAS
ncbi:MAG: CPBP family intramembrane metalloprotease [Phycisphaeraceae bacterium]|nr:CPBP family intramembrane metalloprotease [Phycisphaeraceae bacterium]